MRILTTFFFILLTASRLHASIDEKYVVFSFPKSGTHFIKAIYSNLTAKQIGHDHVHHYEQFSKELLLTHYKDTKIIFPYRDPRDAVISYVHWVDMLLQKGNREWAIFFGHKDWEYWTTERKIEEIIVGDKQNIMLLNVRFLPDLVEALSSHPNACVVRFEDFIGPKAGGDLQLQKNTIQKIVCFILGRGISDQRLEILISNSWGGDGTFHNPAIGKWKDLFTEKIKTLFKNSIWNDALIKLNYENSLDW